jgi:hypothetical protein
VDFFFRRKKVAKRARGTQVKPSRVFLFQIYSSRVEEVALFCGPYTDAEQNSSFHCGRSNGERFIKRRGDAAFENQFPTKRDLTKKTTNLNSNNSLVYVLCTYVGGF